MNQFSVNYFNWFFKKQNLELCLRIIDYGQELGEDHAFLFEYNKNSILKD